MMMDFPKNYSLKRHGITQSLLATYLMCPRRFWYAINLYAGSVSKAMQFGTLMHAVVEEWYRSNGSDKASCAVIENFKFDKIIKVDDAEYMRAVASALAPTYFDIYKGDIKRNVEPEFALDTLHPSGLRVRGKIDGIVGKELLLETKTKGRISEGGIERRMSIDYQTLFYIMGYRMQTGALLSGVVYNVIRFPQRAIKGDLKKFTDDLTKDVAKKPDDYFMRWETAFSRSDIDEFESEFFRNIERVRAEVHFDRNLCACEAPYPCTYINACASGGDTSSLRKKKVLFEEL